MNKKNNPRPPVSTGFWLIKSEPETYSIDQLKADTRTWWTGVRNYQARNFMMQSMKTGDLVLFYHSNAEPPGIAGIAQVCRSAESDPTQFDKKSEYYDPKASKEKPRWFCVQVEFVKKFKQIISLNQIRSVKDLQKMLVLQKGQRLSVQPLTKTEYDVILKMAEMNKI